MSFRKVYKITYRISKILLVLLKLNVNTELYSQYGAVKPLDLYTSFQKAMGNNSSLLGGNSVFDVMETWDSSISYPYINVTRNYESGYVTFTQVIN